MGNHLIIPGGTKVVDASGKFVLPGGVDANVHLQLFGRRGDTGKRRLLHSETEGNKFEKGEVKYAAN